jgi:octanoyl-[GcvH]:protein N-octanoyltransferase
MARFPLNRQHFTVSAGRSWSFDGMQRALAFNLMESDPLQIITGELTGSASLDTAVSRAILQRVSSGDLPETLQVGRPHRVVAFGKHDALTTGFARAVVIATDHGFDPTIRIAGGRAVVFHSQIVRFAWTVPSLDPIVGMVDRFTAVADRAIAVLESLGVPAVMGQLQGEYCPGRYSVHMEGAGKVMGSGQRLTKEAAQVGGMIVVDNATAVNEALIPVYAALGVAMDPARTGAISDRVQIDADIVSQRFALLFATGRERSIGHIDASTMDLAHDLKPQHDPRILA